MSKRLLIVESPGKLKKIKEYLGDGWEIKASVGHICDLPKENGIDKANGFKLNYEISADKKDVVKSLNDAVKRVGKENVYLATDPDREGEAISYHLCRNLGLDHKTAKRVTFQEITKDVIQKAVDKPRTLDLKLVAAQEARRAIDRLVGFEISPLLWKKIKSDSALSAGRVQSVAVKLVVEREKEIENFGSSAVFKISGLFLTPGENKLKAQGTVDYSSADQARDYLKSTDGKNFRIVSVVKEPKRTLPQPPFSTSTLQQDANKKLKFSVDQTMKIAQALYEAGHITYMRTDSVNLSQTAIDELSKFIVSTYGADYLEARTFKNKNESAQEAHEAIRPTHFEHKSIEGSEDEKALYNLIYLRAVASQMQAKRFDVTTVTVNSEAGTDEFKAKASVITFDGFTKAYSEETEEDPADEEIEIKEVLKEGDAMKLISVVARQSYSKPKNRYGEADLVKELEQLGIGRPSTYASIMKNIKDVRKYIVIGNSEGKKLESLTITYENGKVTEQKSFVTIGQARNKFLPSAVARELVPFLQENFERIMDYEFTASCEDAFDKIKDGKDTYLNVVKEFYTHLEKSLSEANVKVQDVQGGERKTVSLGDYEKKPVRVGKGQHGVYVLYKDSFYSVSGVDDFAGITLEDAIEVIKTKKETDKVKKEEKAASVLYTFGKFQILPGKFGPYVTDGKINVTIPKWDQDKLDTYDEEKCKQVIKNYKDFKKKQGK
jgi:DNA topoisomerase I